MKCNVQGAYKNLRYRILNIGEGRFILDMGGSSFWRILFPFFYWMVPVNVYKVDDDELLEQITSPRIEQKSIGWQSWLGGIFAISLGNLIRPMIDYFDMDSTTFINVILLSIMFLVILSFYFYINSRCGKKMNQLIHLKESPKEKLWIRPQSSKHVLHVLFSYILFLGLSILFLATFIQTSNGFVLFGVTLVMFITLMLNVLTIQVGDTTVRFKGK